MLALCRRLLQLLALVLVVALVLWPQPALAGADGGVLFENHCAGCHVNGGNIIRRGKTLKLAALERQGLDSPEAIARVAAAGIGQMSGYGAVLGEGGAEAVAAYVWAQAQAGWPRS
ncbi:MAG: cytochrome C6 [Cyanobacteria bacterium K_DeepCast_35m_m2_155]|nr:cytochrome C6 [Cyanobacteria bacterium K_DeepCast_35m_m2_155]